MLLRPQLLPQLLPVITPVIRYDPSYSTPVIHVINSEEIEDYNGLNRRSPFLAFAMLLFLLSLAGVPPLAGFIAKLYIFVAAMKAGLIALVIVGLINVVISMYYSYSSTGPSTPPRSSII